ncbi:sodium:solute symporter [Planctomycetota bacterium]
MDLSSLGIETNFGIVDWCIVIAYLGLIVSVGIYIRRYIKNATDFMVAGRGLKSLLAIATMIGTELGLVTVVYAAQKGFTGGFAAFHIAIVAAIGALFIGLTGFIVVPLRKLKVMTIPEYYEKRFGKGVRILGGAILAIAGILNMGLFLKAGSIFVSGVTGMVSDFQIKLIMSVMLALVLLYTTLGGMVSVVVLDYIQFVVLSIALLFTTALAINHLGFSEIVDGVARIMGEPGFNPLSEESFGPEYIVWQLLMGGLACSVWAPAVIRALSAENTKVVKRLYTWSSLGFLIRFMIPYFFGICALVFVSKDPKLSAYFLPDGKLADPAITLQAMPLFISQIIPAGLIGIVTAGMLAAFMSSHDSYLLCWSTVLTQDVIAPWFKKPLSSKVRLLMTRIFIVLIGIYILIWGLWYELGQDLWDYMLITGSIYMIGAMVLLFFGLYWKRASKVGAYMALITGFGAVVGLKPVQRFLFDKNWPTEIVGLTVLIAAIIMIIVGSLIFPDKTSTENKE